MYTADELEIRCALAGSPRAEQLIACLEGEIAKRDEELAACRIAVENCDVFRARIAELEDDLKCAHSMLSEVSKAGMALRAELAALKAQEPVAEIALSDDGYKIGLLGALRNHRLPIGTKLYAAPVSEAKAQGVVMPERKTKADYYVYIDEFANEAAAIANAVLDEVARLNAAPVQQVSVPDGYAIVPIVPTPEMIKAALDKPCFDPLGDPLPWSHITRTSYAAMLAAAPSAPAADAGHVFYGMDGNHP